MSEKGIMNCNESSNNIIVCFFLLKNSCRSLKYVTLS
uniref:Uncharacterized protein n=1 Tax=Anguilla anguilla TaxID=7936 RepID=A0A0E9RVC9_ANGAN